MQEAARAIEANATKSLPDLPEDLKAGVNPPSTVNLKADIIANKQVYT